MTKNLLTIIALWTILLIPHLSKAQDYGIDADSTQLVGLPPLPHYVKKPINFALNTRLSANVLFNNTDGYAQTKFFMDQLRFEIRGDLSERIGMRFRTRYTRTPDIGNQDNILNIIDAAIMEIRLIEGSQKYTVRAGKMIFDWGGYEYDFNPIYITKYADPISGNLNGLLGGGFVYRSDNDKNILTLEIANSGINTFSKTYSKDAQAITEGGGVNGIYGTTNQIGQSSAPIAWVFNYRGVLVDEKVETISSIGYYSEAKDLETGQNLGSAVLVLGLKVMPTKKFTAFYDYTRINSSIDRTGYVTKALNGTNLGANGLTGYNGTTARNTAYNTNWIRLDYSVTDRLNILFSGFWGTGLWAGARDAGYANADAHQKVYRTFGCYPGVEYTIIQKQKVRFFTYYVFQSYDYSSFIKENGNAAYANESKISLGLLTPFTFLSFK